MHKSKRIYIMYLICIIIFIIYIPNLIPIKYAAKEKNLKIEKNYILCRNQKVTGFNWLILGDINGKYKNPEDIEIIGKTPYETFNYTIDKTENTFVFYGEFIENRIKDGEDKPHKVFQASDWDILYPIKRNSLRQGFVPQKFLSVYDKIYIIFN